MTSNIKQAVLLCGCCNQICCERELPLDCFSGTPSSSTTALPLTLTVDLSAVPDKGAYTCFNGSGTITFKTAFEGGVCCWEGRIEGFCIDCHGNNFLWFLDMSVCCDDNGWGVSGNPVSGSCAPHLAEAFVPVSCNPLLINGCWTRDIVTCFVSCLDGVFSTESPKFTVCFNIYESP